ncbi:MAG TPA: condensation domain-containing protein, partial [Solirubrobacteraceae bacterium]
LASLGGGNPGEASSAALQPVAERGALPLSFAQQRLWFVDQLEGGSHQYNVASALRLTGRLNVDALRRAFDEIVARHEVLRTVYRSEGGEGWQTPRAARPVLIERIDLSGLGDDEQNRRVHELARAEAETPFDLTGDQLLRLSLLELREDEAVLLFTMHHIASDGWSIGLLVREMTLLYTAFCRSEESTLSPLSIQYADFAHWQRNALAGAELERQVGWWKEALDGIPRLHSLPLDKPRPPRQQFAGRRHHRALCRETLEELRRLAQAHGVTLFVLLQSALSLLIGRWSNEPDVVIGSPVAGRLHKDVEPLIGCFVNTLALRTQLDPSLTFEQLLARSKETIVGAFSHQQVPFEMLVDALRPERSLSHAPLFQILFVLQNTEKFTLELPGLTISEVPSSESVIRYDLELACEEGDDGLSMTWSYAGSLFEAATIERLAASFEVLLASIVFAPQTAIGKLAIVDESDLRAYEAWNVTAASFPREACVHELFEQQARKTPNAMAVELGSARLTYAQLNEKANRLADYLREWGLGADSLVGLCMERSLEMVVSVLAILKAGAAYLPLEPSYPRERIEYIIGDASLAVVLVQPSVIDRLPLSGVDVVLVDDVVSDDFMDGYSVADAAPAATPDN